MCACVLVRVFEKRSDAMEMTCNEIIMSLTWVFRVCVCVCVERGRMGVACLVDATFGFSIKCI